METDPSILWPAHRGKSLCEAPQSLLDQEGTGSDAPAEYRPDGCVKTDRLVSIIVPAYRNPQLLARAILSVQKQTYSHHELIIVDDAGDEETCRLVSTFPRVRYL